MQGSKPAAKGGTGLSFRIIYKKQLESTLQTENRGIIKLFLSDILKAERQCEGYQFTGSEMG